MMRAGGRTAPWSLVAPRPGWRVFSGALTYGPGGAAGNPAYGAVRLLKWLVDRNIAPHIPVWDKSARSDGTFSRADFVFDQGRDIYICPGGAELTSTGNIDQGHTVYYRASKNDCSVCKLKPKCTTAVVRKVTRDINEDVR